MRLSILAATAICVIGLGACSDASPDVTSSSISPAAGVYTVLTIDGVPLPFTAGGETLTSETATVAADGSYVDVAQYLDGTSVTRHGTVSVFGTSETVTRSDGPVYYGTLVNGVSTLNAGGHVFVLKTI